jgi:8-hydroxy-5-deazaflavin:NADPH oxidoreductase
MNITIIGKGNVGGGLADRWERSGHEVARIGRDGGDVSDADVVLLAMPGRAIADALDSVSGLEGKTVIDATNLVRVSPPGGFASNAEYVKSRTGGPTAKAFNINFASLYDQIGDQRVAPSCLYAADDEAREVTEQLIRDAGYDPVSVGGLDNARALEDHIGLVFAVNQAGLGQFFYRIAKPGEL